MINPVLETKQRIRRTKIKSPSWHDLQRLKSLRAFVNKQIESGRYDDSPDLFEQANIYVETLQRKIRNLENKASFD